jgi:hypothetical protein
MLGMVPCNSAEVSSDRVLNRAFLDSSRRAAMTIPGEIHKDLARIRLWRAPGRVPPPGRPQQRQLQEILCSTPLPDQQVGHPQQPGCRLLDEALELRRSPRIGLQA